MRSAGTAAPTQTLIGTVETFDPTAPGVVDQQRHDTARPGRSPAWPPRRVAGQVHVIGGTRGGPVITPVTTHNIFDPATDNWAPSGGTPLATARAYHAAVTGTDGAIYAIGGVDGVGNALSSVERLDPVTHALERGGVDAHRPLGPGRLRGGRQDLRHRR